MILSAGDKTAHKEETPKETSFAFCSQIDYLILFPIKEAFHLKGNQHWPLSASAMPKPIKGNLYATKGSTNSLTQPFLIKWSKALEEKATEF